MAISFHYRPVMDCAGPVSRIAVFLPQSCALPRTAFNALLSGTQSRRCYFCVDFRRSPTITDTGKTAVLPLISTRLALSAFAGPTGRPLPSDGG